MIRLAEQPDLWMADHFLDADTCDLLAGLAREAAATPSVDDEPTVNETGYCQELPIEGIAAFEALRERIEGLFGLQSDIYDTLRYRRYQAGEGHPVHLDCYAMGDRELLATALVSLRDTPAGGETEFPAVGVAVAPRKGRLICWYNHTPDGARDVRSRHGARPVLEGEKEVLLYFIYKEAAAAAHRPLSAPAAQP